MPGILLDTHALYWLVSGEVELAEEALIAIGENQEAGTLFVSPVTAWELSVATKKNPRRGQAAPGRGPARSLVSRSDTRHHGANDPHPAADIM